MEGIKGLSYILTVFIIGSTMFLASAQTISRDGANIFEFDLKMKNVTPKRVCVNSPYPFVVCFKSYFKM